MAVLNLFKKKQSPRNKNATSSVDSNMDKQRKYEALVRAYHKDLFRYAYWLCKDKSVAEDLVQETCLRAWKALDSLQDEKAAKSWLITILRRENARRFERKQLDLVDIDDPGNEGQVNDDGFHQREWLQARLCASILNIESHYFCRSLVGSAGKRLETF